MGGWVKLHRSIVGWEYYTDVPVKTLFVHLLVTAQFEDCKYRGVSLKRGQLLTGRKVLRDQTGLTENQVRRALKHLQTTNHITIKSNRHYSIITVINYEKFQSKAERTTNQNTHRPPTNHRTDHHMQEVKKLRTQETKNITYTHSTNTLDNSKESLTPTSSIVPDLLKKLKPNCVMGVCFLFVFCGGVL